MECKSLYHPSQLSYNRDIFCPDKYIFALTGRLQSNFGQGISCLKCCLNCFLCGIQMATQMWATITPSNTAFTVPPLPDILLHVWMESHDYHNILRSEEQVQRGFYIHPESQKVAVSVWLRRDMLWMKHKDIWNKFDGFHLWIFATTANNKFPLGWIIFCWLVNKPLAV